MSNHRTMIIAHRGASHLASRENSIESFLLAIRLQADMAEFDVRRTKDGALIVFHDKEFNGRPLSELTYGEMEACARRDGYHIPTFLEVVKLCRGKIRMDIELKESGFEERIIRTLRHFCTPADFTIKSFFDIVPYRIKKLWPEVTTGLLLGRRDFGPRGHFNEYFPLRRVRACKCDFISPHYTLVTREFLHRMHRHHVPVMPWTVNKLSRISKYIRMGADAIITDQPDVALYIRSKIEGSCRPEGCDLQHKKGVKR